MKEKRTGMFTGIKEVFSFTAGQTLKGKGFITSTIVIGLCIALLFAAICMIPVLDFEDDESDNGGLTGGSSMEYSFDTIKEVYLLNETRFEDENLRKLFFAADNVIKENTGKEIEKIASIDGELTGNSEAVIIKATEDEGETGKINLSFLTTYNSTVDSDELNSFAEQISEAAEYAVYSVGKLDEKAAMLVSMPTNVENVGMEAEKDTIGMILAKMLIPMIFSLAMYMIVLLHGQSISKVIVADKSSKLIEMLLTSVKPYAIIAGKVLGAAGMAIGQIFVWILSGVIGYAAGNEIAKLISPDYVNMFGEIIDIMQSDTAGVAFSLGAVIIAMVTVIVGFLMYCVLAAFSGAVVSKIEDLSAAASIFQIPVIVAFLVSYFVTIASSTGGNVNRALQMAVYMIPVTSPFSMPAGVILGDMSILQAVLSLAILVVFSVVMVVITGKVYKGKIFNRH